MPSNINVPVEAMRVGALPVSDHYPRSPDRALRDMINEAPRGNLSVNYPPIRTCQCGAQVIRGTPADALHTDEHGPEAGAVTATGETVAAVTSACERCACPVPAGARYCSTRCQAIAIRVRRPGEDAAG